MALRDIPITHHEHTAGNLGENPYRQDANSPTPTRDKIRELLDLEARCAELRRELGPSGHPDMTVELRRETDGRYLATVVGPDILNGVEDYGATPQEACCKALDVLAEVDAGLGTRRGSEAVTEGEVDRYLGNILGTRPPGHTAQDMEDAEVVRKNRQVMFRSQWLCEPAPARPYVPQRNPDSGESMRERSLREMLDAIGLKGCKVSIDQPDRGTAEVLTITMDPPSAVSGIKVRQRIQSKRAIARGGDLRPIIDSMFREFLHCAQDQASR